MQTIVYNNRIYERIYNYIVWPLNAQLKLPAHHNVKYFNRRIIELTVYSALENQFVESSVAQLSMFIDGVPSADTIFRRIARTNWNYILRRMKDFNEMMFSKWKDKPNASAYLAVDFHDIPRYIRKARRRRKRIKKCDDVKRVVAIHAKRGTHYYHRIASIDIVEEQKFTLGFEPVTRDAGWRKHVIFLIKNALSRVHTKAVLMDREFFDGILIDKLRLHGIPYIIRAKRTPFVSGAIEHTKREALTYYVREYVMNENTHKKGRKPVNTTLVIVDNAILEENDPSLYDKDDRYFAFVTNLNVKTMEDAFELARGFRKRWRIETGYRLKETFLARTCSLSYAVRLYFILLSFILSNVWTLINCVFRDDIEFVKIFKDHMPAHMIKITFWMVLITQWPIDKG